MIEIYVSNNFFYLDLDRYFNKKDVFTKTSEGKLNLDY